MLLFDRNCKLVVFVGSEKYELEDFRMEFYIELTDKPEPNTADIRVYGLNELTRLIFFEEHQGIEFYAGYGDDTALIFKGVTVNVNHEKEGPDWVTTISAYDGFDAILDPKNKFNKAYKKGVKIKNIIKDIARHLGLNRYTETISDADVTPYGVVYSGVVKTVLNQLAIDYDLSWSIQMNHLMVVGANMLLDPTAVLLTPETGMVGSPIVSERTEQLPKKRKKKAKPKLIPYVEVTSLLNHLILPGRLIEIKSNQEKVRTGQPTTEKAKKTDADGFYFVKTVVFSGDNRDGEYFATATADAGEDIFYYKTINAAKASSV